MIYNLGAYGAYMWYVQTFIDKIMLKKSKQ